MVFVYPLSDVPIERLTNDSYITMSVQRNEFKSGNHAPDPTISQTYMVIVDWHTTSIMSPSQSTSFRFELRDECLRFVDMLFRNVSILPKLPRLVFLAVEPCHADQNVDIPVRFSVITETAALTSTRNRVPATNVIRKVAYPQHHLSVDPQTHAIAISNALCEWGQPTLLQIIGCKDIAIAMHNIGFNGIEFRVDILKETLASLLESNVTLAVGAASPLSLRTRPRIIPQSSTPNLPSWLAATTRVSSDSVHEDVITGPSFVLWAQDDQTSKAMVKLCERLRQHKQFLLCIGHTSTRSYVVVVIPPRHGAIALIREVGHKETLLPIPCKCTNSMIDMRRMTNESDLRLSTFGQRPTAPRTGMMQKGCENFDSDSDEETAVGLTFLPQDSYDANVLCIGNRIESGDGGGMAANQTNTKIASQMGKRMVNFQVLPIE